MEEEQQSYRDHIATVDEQGKRVWIYPKKPSGRYYNARKLVSYGLLIFLFSAPWIRVDGNPLLQFNLLERKFILFGQIFWPQDFFLFALGMLVAIVFVALFTVIYGRLFCGWICPQTIFMEMVFRRIEYWIEGDWTHQKKLNKQPWNAEKIRKKALKHTLFWVLSFLIANTFLAYIIGTEALVAIVTDNPANHISGLISIVIFTTVFYLVFSKMREQVCTVVCPYGRLQGVLLDNNSLTVAYDHKRGEDRGKYKKGEDRAEANKGDCIDCHQCVHVCPTGIDIRNGTQLECVNCTACMDACDHIMESVGLEKGLIRYDSQNGIENKSKWKLSTKGFAYSAVLLVLMGLLTGMLVTRSDFEVTILRTRGTSFQKATDGVYSNIYDLNLVNKTNDTIPVRLDLLSGKGHIQLIGKDIVLHPQDVFKGKFMVQIHQDSILGKQEELQVGVYGNGELIEQKEINFLGPVL